MGRPRQRFCPKGHIRGTMGALPAERTLTKFPPHRFRDEK